MQAHLASFTPVLCSGRQKVCHLNLQERREQRGRDQHGRDKSGKAFIELLLEEGNRLSVSDHKEWAALAQKIDGAEFTALLDEEWEKLSAKKKKEAMKEAREETADREEEAMKKAREAADRAARDKLSANKKEDSTKKARQETAGAASATADAATTGAAPATTDAASPATGADADADADTGLEQTTTPTAAAAADKKVWAQNKKAWANETRNKEEANLSEQDKHTQGLPESILLKTSEVLLKTSEALNLPKKNNFTESEAFRDTARVAGRCAISQEGCLSPLTTRLWARQIPA